MVNVKQQRREKMAPTIRGETPPDERAAAARAVVASRSVVMVAEGVCFGLYGLKYPIIQIRAIHSATEKRQFGERKGV
jgi:hypothetical protein